MYIQGGPVQSCSLGGPQWGNFPKIRLAVVILIFYPKNEMRWFCFFQGIEIAPNTVLKISRYWNHSKCFIKNFKVLKSPQILYSIKTIKSQVVFWIHRKYSNRQITWGATKRWVVLVLLNSCRILHVEFIPNTHIIESHGEPTKIWAVLVFLVSPWIFKPSNLK